ncbi:MAG: sulfatase [Planctomycetes bacterium]|nr:sulfatase [Planctomycetota bacterium]
MQRVTYKEPFVFLHFRVFAIAFLLLSPPWLVASVAGDADKTSRPPNIVIIFCDDLGYSDIGCFGAKGWKTPNIDRLAAEGMRLTSFYVSQPVCGASRTSLLTGCYANRVGITGAPFPNSTTGINDSEMTLAELVKPKGYATGMQGKWHLGHHPKFLPTHHGFDEYFGLPYSNDMWPHSYGWGKQPKGTKPHHPPLPMIEGDKPAIADVTPEDQAQLTTWYTERAVKFIDKNKDRPFLLYVAHSMPHIPLYVSDKHKGKSQQGLYGDVIEEIDWSVGQIMEALKRNGLDDNTLVLFTSDNGPWLTFGNQGGTARPLREGKGTTFEGGVREPCVVRWPGHVPAGSVCDEPVMTIDVLPTVAKLTGAKLPEHKIDGLDIWPLLSGEKGAKSPHEALFFYYGRNNLEAMRSGQWKLHFPHGYLSARPGRDGTAGGNKRANIGLALYDLSSDIGEKKDVAAEHPDVVERLKKLADAMREDLGDDLAGRKSGTGTREPGKL